MLNTACVVLVIWREKQRKGAKSKHFKKFQYEHLHEAHDPMRYLNIPVHVPEECIELKTSCLMILVHDFDLLHVYLLTFQFTT